MTLEEQFEKMTDEQIIAINKDINNRSKKEKEIIKKRIKKIEKEGAYIENEFELQKYGYRSTEILVFVITIIGCFSLKKSIVEGDDLISMYSKIFVVAFFLIGSGAIIIKIQFMKIIVNFEKITIRIFFYKREIPFRDIVKFYRTGLYEIHFGKKMMYDYDDKICIETKKRKYTFPGIKECSISRLEMVLRKSKGNKD